MDTPITRAEHEEFRKRIEERDNRQDKRLEILEENTKQMGSLTVSVAEMAQSIKQMVKVQEQHGRQLEELKSRDGKMWRKAVGYVVTTVISFVLGFIATKIGM